MDVSGVVIDPQTPVPIEPGWSIIGYLPAEPLPTAEAVSTILDELLLIKREDGAFFSPQWEFDGIGAMEPGEGYKVSITTLHPGIS
jgi:hypothetical protein